jgi:hypothetical protein
VTELPPLMAETEEWRLHALGCECGYVTRAELPEGVPKGACGPRLQAALAYLTGLGRLTKRPIQEVMEDLFGIPMSLGSIVAQQQSVSEAVAPAVEEAKAYARQQNRKVMDYLTEACRRALVGKNPPSLLPGRAREAAA